MHRREPQIPAQMLSQGKHVFLSPKAAHPPSILSPTWGRGGALRIQTPAAASWHHYVGLKVAGRVGARKGTWQGRPPRGRQDSQEQRGRGTGDRPWGLLPEGRRQGWHVLPAWGHQGELGAAKTDRDSAVRLPASHRVAPATPALSAPLSGWEATGWRQ